MAKVRKQVYISKELDTYIKQIAKSKEISISNTIEDIIKEHKIKSESKRMLSRE